MLATQLRAALDGCPRPDLPKVSSLLWKAFAAGQVTEQEAEALSQAIEAKKAIPAPQRPARRHLGSRPKQTSASHPTDGGVHSPSSQSVGLGSIRGAGCANLLRIRGELTAAVSRSATEAVESHGTRLISP